MPTSYYNLKGWSLIEISIVMCCLSMVVILAVPWWHNHIQHKQLINAKQTIYQAVNYARVLAITKQTSLSLCALGNNWAEGFRLVLHHDGAKCGQLQAVREWRLKQSTKLSIQWHGFANNDQLRFDSQIQRWAVNGRFSINLKEQKPVQLFVNRVGTITDYLDS